MADKQKPHTYERREFMAMAGTGVVVLAGISLFVGKAQASGDKLSEAVKAKIGDKSQKSGRIKIELPQIAENGNTVPVGFEIESPMTDDDYVKAVHIFADKNPLADVATFRFTPQSGKAKVSTRMRLLKTQNVHVIAEMSNGSVYAAKRAVKVTIGGCGG